MNWTGEDFLKLVLQVLGVLIGGGLLTFVTSILRRKPETRKLNTASDVDTATVDEKRAAAQHQLITDLQATGEVYRSDLRELRGEVERLKQREQSAQLNFARELRDANGVNAQLQTRVAQLENAVAIANSQLSDYRTHYRTRDLSGPNHRGE